MPKSIQQRLTALQQQRWNAAKALYHNLKSQALIHNAQIIFDGESIRAEQIKIGDSTIVIEIDNCFYIHFDANPELDEGLYTSIQKFKEQFYSDFKLMKSIKF